MLQVRVRDAEIGKVMAVVKQRVGAVNMKVGRVIARYGRLVENRIKVLMTETPKTGNIYPRGKNRIHIASSKGNPPAVDYGDLRSSINTELSRLSALVWTDKEYAFWLEFGTKNIAARPAFTVAFEEYREEILSEIKKAIKEGIED